MATKYMGKEFAPKDAETLKSEITTDLGIEYEGNEEMVDKLVARELKDEEFKASLHADKNKHLEGKKKREELLKKAGLDPETGEKLQPNGGEAGDSTPKNEGLSAKDVIALRDVHEEDVDYLLDEAKLRGKSVSDLKKDPYVKIILQTRAEERNSAQAANTGNKRGTTKSSADELLKKVEKADENMSPDELKEAAKKMVESLSSK